MAVCDYASRMYQTAANGRVPTTFGRALPFLLMLAAVFLLNFLSRICLAPLLPAIEPELGITHAQSGGIFLALAVGNTMGLVSSGFVSCRIGHKYTISLASFLFGSGILVASTIHDLLAFKAVLLLSGLGAGLYLPSGIATITAVVRRQDWGKALAVHEIAPNLSFVLAPVLAEAVLLRLEWRHALVLLGSAQLVASVCFALLGGSSFKGRRPDFTAIGQVLRTPAFWALMGGFSLGVGSSLGPYSMIPLYLTDLGYSRAQANELLAVSRVAGLFTAFVGGWFTDRVGARNMLIAFFVLNGAACAFIGLASGELIRLAVMIQPMTSVLFFAPAFTLLSQTFEQDLRNLAVSCISPVSVLVGQGVSPFLLGLMGDVGAFREGFILVGAVVMSGVLIPILLCRRTSC